MKLYVKFKYNKKYPELQEGSLAQVDSPSIQVVFSATIRDRLDRTSVSSTALCIKLSLQLTTRVQHHHVISNLICNCNGN